jgi:hypothetical protein
MAEPDSEKYVLLPATNGPQHFVITGRQAVAKKVNELMGILNNTDKTVMREFLEVGAKNRFAISRGDGNYGSPTMLIAPVEEV